MFVGCCGASWFCTVGQASRLSLASKQHRWRVDLSVSGLTPGNDFQVTEFSVGR